MTTIYLIRHAEAEGNLYRRAHGHYDSLITENGYLQIRALAKRFQDVEIDVVWSSDLFRTMTTARAILEPHGKNLNTHQGLREINMGVWEDKTWGQLAKEDPEAMAQFAGSSQSWCPDHGESFEKLTERIGKTMTELAKQHDGQTMAVICHGLAIRQFMAYVEKLPMEEWGSSPHGDNTSVSKVIWDGSGFTVEFSADNSHLPEEISTFARQKWWKKESPTRDINLWYEEKSQEDKDYQSAVLEVWGAKPPTSPVPKTVYRASFEGEAAGWISLGDDGEVVLLYLHPEFRKDRNGLQLLGQAVSHCRSKGATQLYIRPPEGADMGFFEAFGFEAAEGRLEKYIGYQPRAVIL